MLNKEYPKPHQSVIADRARAVFLFGPFRLDARERVLLRDDCPVALTPKAFDTLLVLVSYGGQLVEKERLLEEVWPDTFVEEKTLAQNVLTIRKALGRTEAGAHYIETVPKHGYRFAAEVRVERADAGGFVAASRSRTELVVEEEYEIDYASPDGPDASRLLDAHEQTGARSLGWDAEETKAATALHAAFATRPATHETALQHAPQTANGTRRGPRLAVVVAVVAACALVAGGAFMLRRVVFKTSEPFREYQLTKLTTTGDVEALAVSPDGRFAAYASTDAGRSRLLVRQVDGTGTVEVVPSAEARYVGVTFSHDGSRLYYVTRQNGEAGIYGELFSVPVFGGVPKKLIHDVDSPAGVAPDGRLAFVRVSLDQKETTLVVADADGASERALSTLPRGEGFAMTGPAWSPDGRLIACASNDDPTRKWSARLLVVNTSDGRVRPFSSNRWSWIGRAAWAADGGGVFLVAWDNESPAMSDQVWYVSYPGDATRRVTNDVSGYLGISLSADARTLLVARSERVASFYDARLAAVGEARKLGGVSADLFGNRYGISWTPDGRVVYGSTAGGEPNVWLMDADGANRRQLTTERGGNVEPVVSPDGSAVVFVSYRTGTRHLWRMDINGGDPRQLTFGEADNSPAFTPDGKWIVYSSYVGNRPALWKVAAVGGTPQRLTDFVADKPSFSPDGKLVACYRYAAPLARASVVLVSLDDGKVVKELSPPNLSDIEGVKWTADGAGLVYVADLRGVSNLWLQPTDGTAAHAVTTFNSDRIFRFDLSRDGRLIYERGATITDAVLLRSK